MYMWMWRCDWAQVGVGDGDAAGDPAEKDPSFWYSCVGGPEEESPRESDPNDATSGVGPTPTPPHRKTNGTEKTTPPRRRAGTTWQQLPRPTHGRIDFWCAGARPRHA